MGTSVDFANSDPKMVQLFLKFLRNICGVQESKIRIYLYCYPQHNLNQLVRYWSGVTDVPRTQFTRPFVRQDAAGKVGQKLKHGLVHVRYGDKKLLWQLNQWAEEYCK